MKKFIALDANKYKLKKDIVPVPLTWKTKTIRGWCNKVKMTKEDIIIGHSIGGAVALIVASKTPPKELHLYAPNPIFTEFLELFKKHAGKHLRGRIKELRPIPIPDISCPVYIYIGDKEHPLMIADVKTISKHIPQAVFKLVKGADHMSVVSEHLENSAKSTKRGTKKTK